MLFEIKSFQDRIAHLYPKVMDLSLGRIENLLKKLGNPQNSIERIMSWIILFLGALEQSMRELEFQLNYQRLQMEM